ncbi:hypothetical protein [Geoalkalibacter sp.]|uniref:hypothetical protein n=1 Tax=Geoalkalibacter sp. TaxID=3041440 RepID=UPI00272DECA0|nr:hypothetical protein [Geoalkalibacter sp.]
MRLSFFLAILFTATLALAQQPPAAPEKQPPMAPAPPMPTPPKQAPGTSALGDENLLELLQAQTAAIKALNEKVGELEKRIERIEEGAP